MFNPAEVQEAFDWCDKQLQTLMVGTWCQGQPSEYFFGFDQDKLEPESVAGCLLVRAEVFVENGQVSVMEHELEYDSLARRALQLALARLGYPVRLRPRILDLCEKDGEEVARMLTGHYDNLAAINDKAEFNEQGFHSADEAINALEEAKLVLKEFCLGGE